MLAGSAAASSASTKCCSSSMLSSPSPGQLALTAGPPVEKPKLSDASADPAALFSPAFTVKLHFSPAGRSAIEVVDPVARIDPVAVPLGRALDVERRGETRITKGDHRFREAGRDLTDALDLAPRAESLDLDRHLSRRIEREARRGSQSRPPPQSHAFSSSLPAFAACLRRMLTRNHARVINSRKRRTTTAALRRASRKSRHWPAHRGPR